jgi:SpoVK/Ycf46/Vps4 family AAA+-type ATPase
VDSKLAIPSELEKLVTMIDVKLPDKEEIEAIVREMAETNYASIEDGFMPELTTALGGLSEFEIKQIINLAIANDGRLTKDDIPLIHQEKRQAIQKSGLLEMIEVGNEQVGGLKVLRRYLSMNGPIFKNPGKALEYGVGIPAGVMIVGMPGCGKSLTAKCIAKEFGVPLLRLDVGRLMGKFVGESEENLRRAIRVAESAAPCILWIDEIEKAFAGIGDSGGGSVTTRMFGYFLTWMQEKKSCIYVVATANDISNLPPEFLRRGRFDEIFQVKFPNRQERREIFEIQIKKRNKGSLPAGINADRLAELLKDEQNYSGADIESIVKEAMKRLFVRNIQSGAEEAQWKKLSQGDLEAIIAETPSSYHSQKEKLDKMLEKLKKLDVKSAT